MYQLRIRHLLPYISLFVAALLGFFVLQPRISVTDIDSIAYIEGAYSLQSTRAYANLSGGIINHWPPGYSFLLSFASEPLTFAYILNVCLFALATVLLCALARENNWDWLPALSFSIAIGFGFFLSIARFAKPDILSFTVFLLGLELYIHPVSRIRQLGYALWSVLIPVKLIALVFIPAGILTELFSAWRERTKIRWGSLLVAGFIWAAAIALIIGFNLATIGSAIPPSHPSSNASSLFQSVIQFFTSVPREFLATWYGSLRSLNVFIPFFVVLALSLASLATLRFQRSKARFAYLGISLLVMTGLLVIVRDFDVNPRLTAYAFFPLILCFRPRARWNVVWGIYAVATLLFAVYNASSVGRFGLNDPRYQQIAQEVVAQMQLPQQSVLYSNVEHLLDVQARVATIPLTNKDTPNLLSNRAYLLVFDLPNYDAIMQPVTPVTISTDWCEVDSIEHVVLWQKCAP